MVGGCVGRLVTGSVGKDSDHLQLIKFGPFCAPREGGLQQGKNFWVHLTTASRQCLRLSGRFFHYIKVMFAHSYIENTQ